jgi:hypothetical protein
VVDSANVKPAVDSTVLLLTWLDYKNSY